MYWLLYDISDNRRRDKLARLCLDFGLKRVQKSCFFGDLEKKQLDKFERHMEKLLEAEDQVCLVPIPGKAIPEMKTWGNGEDPRAGIKQDMVCFL